MAIIEACIPTFNSLVKTNAELTNESTASYDEIAKLFTGHLKDARKKMSAAGYSEEMSDHALFALCALIDEKVLESDWSGRSEWQRTLLQQVFFQINHGGNEFFSRLNKLNEVLPDHQDVREVYLYCLKLGFAGCYYETGAQSQLNEITGANYALLSKRDETDIFGVEFKEPVEPMAGENMLYVVRNALVAWAPVVLIVASYFYFRADIAAVIGLLS
tara:strand:- start:608 stop:1258 length:651 start_codon:yes stop_codon:yes gene_type:complete